MLLFKKMFGSLKLRPKVCEFTSVCKNTRMIEMDSNGMGAVIVESLPCLRITHFYDERRSVSIPLFFPYLYFMINFVESRTPYGKQYKFCELRVFASSKRLNNINQKVYRLPLGNQQTSGYYCLGDGAPFGNYNSVEELSKAAMASWWSTLYVQTILDPRIIRWRTLSFFRSPYLLRGLVMRIFEKRLSFYFKRSRESDEFFEYESSENRDGVAGCKQAG